MFKGTNKIEDEDNFFQLNNRVTRPKLDIVFMSLSLNYELIIRYYQFSTSNTQMFRKTNISDPLIRTRTCAYQGEEISIFRRMNDPNFFSIFLTYKNMLKVNNRNARLIWWMCSYIKTKKSKKSIVSSVSSPDPSGIIWDSLAHSNRPCQVHSRIDRPWGRHIG